jgi:hypothetical protein
VSPPVRRGAAVVVLLCAGCRDEPSASDARADQVREVGEDADLPDDVVDVLELAARGAGATFQVTYPGDDGTAIVISQAPPDRRIDVVAGDRVVESRVVRGGIGYHCAPPPDDPAESLECTRSETGLDGPGAFTEEALQSFAEDLAASRDELELRVEARTIAETDATCLIAGDETICLSDEGAQLLVDVGDERLSATAYTTDVPDGTFDT